MEYELRDVREALRAEERKFILLNEKLKAKMVMWFYWRSLHARSCSRWYLQTNIYMIYTSVK